PRVRVLYFATTTTPSIYPLSLHDALPISPSSAPAARNPSGPAEPPTPSTIRPAATATAAVNAPPSSSSTSDTFDSGDPSLRAWRSEEHTSELQSRGHLVCRLLLEKKKKQQ